MTVKEVMAGITPSADYAGLEMADDFVLAFQTADTQQDVNDYLCRRLGIPIRGAKGKEQER